MKISIKNISGKNQGELETKFEVVENGKGTQAVHDAVTAYRAAQRSGTACTKTVGDVQGSNKKPWKQKGTGRARAGSLRSPLWAGGGVVFGPKPRDFSKKVSKSTKQLALRKALSERLKLGDVVVVDDLKLASPKTKDFVKVINALELNGSTTLVISNGEENKNLSLSARNIVGVTLTTGESLNTYDVLRPDKLLFTKSAFEQVEARLNKE
ncbi:MAG TPA: 50S ribosomal protein L4 [Verrucomicrobiae bacterium]|nr:50S ribosomal protein L4 [Verrucomicrobiae bacterium]